MQHPAFLIIEDEAAIALDLQQRVLSYGYEVFSLVHSAEEALALAPTLPALVIALVDINLGKGMNGVQLSKILRDQFSVPSIFITGYFDNNHIRQAKTAEPYSYIVKPFTDLELRTAIEMAAYRQAQETKRLAEEERMVALQRQVTMLEKQQAIARFAAGIAHDLNNVLTAIVGNLQFVMHHGNLSDTNSDVISKALNNCDSCTFLVQRLLGVSRPISALVQQIELTETTREIVEFVQRTWDSNVTTSVEHSKPLFLNLNLNQYRHILVNLLLNAKEAMPDGGIISITFNSKTLEPAQIQNPASGQNHFTVICVEDQGTGIPPEKLAKVFDPFYSTKANGTGLGLAMVADALKEIGGWISVHSDGRSGTRFSLYFPMGDCIEAPDEEPQTDSGDHGCILILDDETTIVDIFKLFFSNAGYQVEGFTLPSEALAWYKDHGDKVGLIVLDLVLPEISALECFRSFRTENADAKVVLISGYAPPGIVDDLLSQGALAFYQKPLDFNELLILFEKEVIKANERVAPSVI
ncbi:MAG: response regulator [Bdellovibrionales bacterium]|nr:response regulator [Bdellovibrionales bacterium]